MRVLPANTFIALSLLLNISAFAEESVSTKDNLVSDDFLQTTEEMFPLTPEEIKNLRDIVEGKQKAIHKIDIPKSTTLKTIPVSLAPGADTPVIELLPRHAIAFEIIDKSGAPWPITFHTVGDSDQFNVIVPDAGNVNVVTITPQTASGRSNLILQLDGESTPISITLQASTSIAKFHDRMTLLIDGQGPKAELPRAISIPVTESSTLLGVLDGIKPLKSRRLVPSNEVVSDAWVQGKSLWMRGVFTLASPSPLEQVAGAGGVKAYRIGYVPVLVIYTEAGETLKITFKEK